MLVDWHRRGEASKDLIGLSLAADAGLVAGLLDLTGGPYNPFIVMYVVYVWAAAVLALAAMGPVDRHVSLLGFAWLVFDHLQAEKVEHHRVNDLPTHLFTAWLAATTVAEVIVHYVSAADAALALRQQELEQARERAARSESLASLAPWPPEPRTSCPHHSARLPWSLANCSATPSRQRWTSTRFARTRG